MPIRLSKVNAYADIGPKRGSVVLLKVNAYADLGPRQGSVVISKVSVYAHRLVFRAGSIIITKVNAYGWEGYVATTTFSRRRGFMNFNP